MNKLLISNLTQVQKRLFTFTTILTYHINDVSIIDVNIFVELKNYITIYFSYF
jgi:hypothetical protein